MKYDLYLKIGGQWRYFTYVVNKNLKEGDPLSVMYDGVIKEYIILHIIQLFNNNEPIFLVEENKNITPIAQDNLIDYSIIKKMMRK